MATIAELQTKLTLDRSLLTRGLNAATSDIKNFGRTFKGELVLVGAAVAALGVGLYSLKSVIDGAEERISKLVDTSTRLGVGVEALQQLQFAAGQSGISVDSLNSSLGKMLSNIGAAAAGSTTAAEAFNKLNLNVSELSKMDAVEQYLSISDAIKQLTNSTQQAASVKSIFGKGGIEQLSALKENIRGLISEYKTLGVMLSGDQANAIERYGDSVQKLDVVWEGFKNQLAAALAGPFAQYIQWIIDAVTNMGGMESFAKTLGDAIVSSMGKGFEAVKAVADEFERLAQTQRINELATAADVLKAANTDVMFASGPKGNPNWQANALKAQAEALKQVLDLQKRNNTLDDEKSSFLAKLNVGLGTQLRTQEEIEELAAKSPLKINLNAQQEMTDELKLQESAIEKSIRLEKTRFDNQKNMTTEMKRQVDAAHNLYQEVRAAQSFGKDLKKDLDSVEASIRQDRQENLSGRLNSQGGIFHEGDRDPDLDRYAPTQDRQGRQLKDSGDSQRTALLKEEYNKKIEDFMEQQKHTEYLQSIDKIQYQQGLEEKMSLGKLEERLVEIRQGLHSIAAALGGGGAGQTSQLKDNPQTPSTSDTAVQVEVTVTPSPDFEFSITNSSSNKAAIAQGVDSAMSNAARSQ